MSEYYLEITIAVIIWNLLLSLVLAAALYKYRRLTSGAKVKNFSGVLERQVTINDRQEQRLKELEESLARVREDARGYLRQVGVVRFNPYNDVGGDQSFALTILDSRKNGLSLTGLHGREGTRLYAKTIADGKGQEYELSAEEKLALNKQ